MNINPQSLNEAYRLAWESGKVESGRLAKALTLVAGTQCTYVHANLDHSSTYEYLVPGTEVPWYAVKVVKSASGKVTLTGHSCKDHAKNLRTCKHLICIMLIVKAQELTPVVKPAVSATRREFTVREMTAMRELLVD